MSRQRRSRTEEFLCQANKIKEQLLGIKIRLSDLDDAIDEQAVAIEVAQNHAIQLKQNLDSLEARARQLNFRG